MEALILALIVAGVSVQSVCKKAYSNKVAGGVFSFTGASVLFAMIVFLFTSNGKLDFSVDLIWYSIAFAVVYCTSSLCSLMAIKTGSLSLTSLFTQYSLLIPTFFGIIAYNEETGPMLYTGIALLVVSLWIINYVRGEEKHFSVKWILFIFLAFVGNGMCSVVQNIQQHAFDQNGKSEFMIIALAIVAVWMFVLGVITEKKEMGTNLRKGFWMYAVCGIANGVVNYLVLYLYGIKFPASVSQPVISAGGIILTGLISIFVYKEKLTRNQLIGMLLGTVAIVVLNI